MYCIKHFTDLYLWPSGLYICSLPTRKPREYKLLLLLLLFKHAFNAISNRFYFEFEVFYLRSYVLSCIVMHLCLL